MDDNEFKHRHELKFWSKKVMEEKTLKQISGGAPYEKFYIDDFDLTHEDYEGKSILDIGCGPRGSLEWADMASLRVGLDPLVNDYYKLGGGTLFHKMHYVMGYSENMPFEDETFDFVFSINSLDHVDDLDETISEIKRVVKVGGICGIIVDVNHKPTKTEPLTINLNLKDNFLDVFEVVEERVYETVFKTGFRENLDNPTFYDFDNKEIRPGILLLKLKKIKEFESEGKGGAKANADVFNSLADENLKLKKENLKFKKQNSKFKKENANLTKENEKLSKENVKLGKENAKIKKDCKSSKEELKLFKRRKIVRIVDKIKDPK
ncbi:methyltransferase domain-containing protein [Methanobrevibacter sp.]|uniref:class I SAM-dependent methyltransferase n=1 Tax=Methanobrevibacter sp. TaxID=66852 RepID=UPI003864FAB5